ncbi:DUF2155 domain-containing protein [Methylovirgula sp. 4M-Z18]|uniref:DUF2155 domain-containing protein n=1 Tax=Methylovirgula sp. 4M-Z18 TaxID=2293567 RepID=UPI000E2FDB36|nr:DUF2155 domain-containing protein [Methylovirgula sp. 4M-Z18]RFB80367.1 DUF2155 domain-containing protein [Methylovirgula sp. 4M-Z18]
MTKHMTPKAAAIGILTVAAGFTASADVAYADKIKNPVAIFQKLDKITGRISDKPIELEIDKPARIDGTTLVVTPRVCYTRPQTESPLTTSFVEVNDIQTDGQQKRIFTGWMYADSPGLHGLEHPIYDVWLIGCKGGTQVIVTPPDPNDEPPPAPLMKPAPVAKAPPRQAPVRTAQPQPEYAPPPQPAKPKSLFDALFGGQ